MIILVIDLRGIYARKSKRHAPIAADLHRPGAFPRALQFMKVQTGQVHVARISSGIQPAKNQSKTVGLSGLDATPTTRRKEALQTLVPKCPDRHSMSVTHMVTDHKRGLRPDGS